MSTTWLGPFRRDRCESLKSRKSISACLQREREPDQDVNVEEKTHGDAPLRAPPFPARPAFRR
jgi:hypothetical protein